MKGSIRIAFGFICIILALGLIEDCAGECVRELHFIDYALAATLALSGLFFGLWGAQAANGDTL